MSQLEFKPTKVYASPATVHGGNFSDKMKKVQYLVLLKNIAVMFRRARIEAATIPDLHSITDSAVIVFMNISKD